MVFRMLVMLFLVRAMFQSQALVPKWVFVAGIVCGAVVLVMSAVLLTRLIHSDFGPQASKTTCLHAAPTKDGREAAEEASEAVASSAKTGFASGVRMSAASASATATATAAAADDLLLRSRAGQSFNKKTS